MSNTQRFALVAAVGDAVDNAVEQAYLGEAKGGVIMRIEVNSDTISVDVVDHGRWRPFQRRDERDAAACSRTS